jgi:hypothetical protein
VELTPYKEVHCGAGVVPRCLTRGDLTRVSSSGDDVSSSNDDVDSDHYLLLDSAVGGGLRMLPLAPSDTAVTTVSGNTYTRCIYDEQQYMLSSMHDAVDFVEMCSMKCHSLWVALTQVATTWYNISQCRNVVYCIVKFCYGYSNMPRSYCSTMLLSTCT